jgi:oxygen-independent coproporphyrinogen-3 oxidase
MNPTLGIYLSVPFCRTKCSFCNFASDVFSRAVFDRYIDRVSQDIANAPRLARDMNARLPQQADSIYLGGGTPTVLEPAQLARLFAAVRRQFELLPGAEITVECAPGTLTPVMLETLQACGVNRISLGVQSFIDAEAAAVGRLHKRSTTLDDIARLRAAGIANLSVDLIAGLPHQTAESWQKSLDEVVAAGVPHVSVYMLEVDEDSRLGRELIAGGTRYHAHFVPDEDATADFYLAACETLNAAGIQQYEISNFARPGSESQHNLKYWTRQPYLGFGVDAHSMLLASPPDSNLTAPRAVRFATPDTLDQFVAGTPPNHTPIHSPEALEEAFFLGLRLNQGVNLDLLAAEFEKESVDKAQPAIAQLTAEGLLQQRDRQISLTTRGRLLSNEAFQRFLGS